ncbi:hypothetical protein LY78DRAFT_678371 [Colletotrichum sublineola]|nr:hypothetical protein LY78DRAFT_678371 [Colletotrichum sublineola]
MAPDTADDQGGDAKGIEKRRAEYLDWGGIIYLDCTSATILLPGRRRRRRREIRVMAASAPLGTATGRSSTRAPACRTRGPVPCPGHRHPRHPRAAQGYMNHSRGSLGCWLLLREVWRARPRLQVFGHVHRGYGREAVMFVVLQAAYEDVVLRDAVAKQQGTASSWIEGWVFVIWNREKAMSNNYADKTPPSSPPDNEKNFPA